MGWQPLKSILKFKIFVIQGSMVAAPLFFWNKFTLMDLHVYF